MQLKKEPSKDYTPPKNPQPVKRPPWDDGRCGGWVGPPPGQQESWEYEKWIQDMER